MHRSFRFPECKELSLVLHAVGIEHAIERHLFGWRVVVPAHDELRAREQWLLYQRENKAAPPRNLDVEPRPGALTGAILWAFALMLLYSFQTNHAFGFDWTAAGKIDVAAVRAGEWWRSVTALTLHGDVAHLFVNIGFGAIFGTLLAREIGAGYAWLVILLGGAAGNLMNVVVQQPTHTAVGASTAVFAALGVLGAYYWTARRTLRHSWASRASPLVGALIMLAWIGTGNERTDIVAHLTGFIAGFGIGAALGRLPRRPGVHEGRQWLSALATLAIIGLAWWLALPAAS